MTNSQETILVLLIVWVASIIGFENIFVFGGIYYFLSTCGPAQNGNIGLISFIIFVAIKWLLSYDVVTE